MLNTAIGTPSTSTVRLVPGGNSACAATMVHSSMSQHPQLQARRLIHHALRPGRLPYQFDVDIAYAFHQPHGSGDGVGEGLCHGTTGRRQGHANTDIAAVLVDVQRIDE